MFSSLEQLNIFNIYNYFSIEDFLIVFFLYNFFKYLIMCTIVELI